MIDLTVLEFDDRISPDDWCRPLSLYTMSGGMSDSLSFKSQYSGTPENNVKWVQVKHVFGECWDNKTVLEITNALGIRYEFVRGNVPILHRLDMSDYNKVR